MKKRVMALSIQLKEQVQSSEPFQFNETMIHAILSGLSIVYDEVFIWASKNQIAVWVVGTHCDFLVRAFDHHQLQYKSIELLKEAKAIAFFRNISDCKIWKKEKVIDKLKGLYHARELSKEHGALGLVLYEMVAEGILTLSNHPMVTAARNSYTWQRRSPAAISKDYVVDTKMLDLFYRFSIN